MLIHCFLSVAGQLPSPIKENKKEVSNPPLENLSENPSDGLTAVATDSSEQQPNGTAYNWSGELNNINDMSEDVTYLGELFRLSKSV